MTRDEARAEVIDAIEGNGRDIARAEEFDIDAIVDETYEWSDIRGYRPSVGNDAFWQSVERHAIEESS